MDSRRPHARPSTCITDATRTAANGSLSHRIQLEGRQDELRELADSFDTMLARLAAHDAEQKRFAAEQQRFAANASHELRTPLAITQTLLNAAPNDPDRDNDELVARLHTVNARAIDLTEALLLLSRADQRAFAREHVDLSLIAEEAAETLLPLAEGRGLTIETSGDPDPCDRFACAPAAAQHEPRAQLAVHNLPEQGTVWVTDQRGRGACRSSPSRTPARSSPHRSVSTLAEPFQRGSRRIRTDHAGVGLGLAIVKSITQAHDGTLTLTPRAAGGLRVTVQLPAGPPHTARADEEKHFEQEHLEQRA